MLRTCAYTLFAYVARLFIARRTGDNRKLIMKIIHNFCPGGIGSAKTLDKRMSNAGIDELARNLKAVSVGTPITHANQWDNASNKKLFHSFIYLFCYLMLYLPSFLNDTFTAAKGYTNKSARNQTKFKRVETFQQVVVCPVTPSGILRIQKKYGEFEATE